MSVTINDKYAKPGGGLKGKIPFKSPTGQRYGHIPEAVYNILNKYGSDAHLYTFGPGVPILGPELVVNGSGDSTAGWNQYLGTASSIGGEFVFTANAGAAYPNMNVGVPVTVGKRYRISGKARVGSSGNNVGFNIGNAFSPTFNGVTNTTAVMQPWSFDTTAISAGANIIAVVAAASATAGTSFFGDISVREILGYSNIYSGFTAGNYFDSAGSTQASVDSSVGLVLDAAGSVGAELLPPGTVGAAVGAPGSLPTGWQGGITINGITRQVVNVGADFIDLRLTGTSTSTWADFLGVIGTTVPVTPGQTFRFALPTDTVVGGSMPAGGSVSYGAVFQLSGTFVSQVAMQNGVVTVPVGVNQLRLFNSIANYSSGAAVDVTIRVPASASCKQITGTHASQSTPGYKPTLRKGIVNLLTYSNDLTNAAWGKLSSPTITPNASTGPGGIGFAQRLLCNTNANVYHTLAVSVGVVSTVAVIFKQDASPEFGMEFNAGITGALRYEFGVGIITNSCLTNPTVVALQDGYYLLAGQVTSTTVNPNFFLYGNGYYTAPSGASLVYATGHFAGTLTAAQILAAGGIPLTTTAPASSQAGVNYLEFDGVDDRLALGGPLFQMADDHCVVVGVSKESTDTNSPGVFGMSGGATDLMGITFSSAWVQYFLNAGGSPAYRVSSSAYQSTPVVATGRKVGSSAVLRVNGVQQGAPLSTAACGSNVMTAATAGYQSYGGVASPLKGRMFPVIAIKGTVSDADLLVLEKFVAQLSGVTL